MADESWRVPTPVQELAAGAEVPPSRYVVREQDRPASLLLAADMPEPPVVDLSRLPAADEVAKLRSALQDWGFFLLTNHGIEASLMDGLMNASRDFFRQPLEEKQKYSNLIGGKNFQVEGYGNDSVISQDQILDWHDRLHIRVEPEDERNLAYWPKHPEPFRDIVHEFASKTSEIRYNILREMAKILELDEDYLISQIGDKAPAFARFNFYPPCPKPELVLGIKPHTDGGTVTIVVVDNEVGGLQVQRDGVWYTVPTKPHSLVVNLGDSMQIMTNGIFKSPVHRVVTNAEKERLSVVMFYSMDPDKELEPLAELLNEERPAMYKKLNVKTYGKGFWDAFALGERTIDFLKARVDKEAAPST